MFKETGALIDGRTGEVVAPAEVARRVGRRRDALAAEGLRPGDRAAVGHGNSVEFFVDLLALWSLEACAVPLDPAATPSETERILAHAGAQALLTPGRVRRLRPSANAEPGRALIVYTSGTTAGPKGVIHTFTGLAAKFRALSGAIDAGSWKRAVCLLPTHFGHGLICNGLWPWLSSKDLVVYPSNDLQVLSRLGEALDEHRADFFSTVPSIWRWVLHTGAAPPRLKTLKRVHCASAALDAGLWERAGAWIGAAPLLNVYGTTETGGWIAGTDPGERPEDGLVGRGWGCAFEARNAKDGAGEIWARTDALMEGYVGEPALTAACVKDGWYRTGDLGAVEAGRVRLRGRIDDVINKAGLKVYPDEVEEVLRLCADVADVCVFAEPHDIFGEEVAAAVVLRGDDMGRVQGWCDGRLSPFKIPRRWYELKSIPRNERGKVSRRGVAEACRRENERD